MLLLQKKKPDLELLRELYQDEEDLKKSWTKANYPFDDNQWRDWFKGDSDKQCYSLYLMEGERVIGHGAVLDYISGAKVTYLCFLLIRPELRALGHGKTLVSMMCDFVKEELNKEEVHLMVDPLNLKAFNCYISCGFSYVEGDNPRRYKKML